MVDLYSKARVAIILGGEGSHFRGGGGGRGQIRGSLL